MTCITLLLSMCTVLFLDGKWIQVASTAHAMSNVFYGVAMQSWTSHNLLASTFWAASWQDDLGHLLPSVESRNEATGCSLNLAVIARIKLSLDHAWVSCAEIRQHRSDSGFDWSQRTEMLHPPTWIWWHDHKNTRISGCPSNIKSVFKWSLTAASFIYEWMFL